MTIALIGSRLLRSRALTILPGCLVASAISASAQLVKPVANAGLNQQAVTGVRVTLDGSGSTSGTGTALTYDWTLVTRPMGSGAALSGAATANPTFVPDVPGTYTTKLVVAAGKTKSKPDTVDIVARSNRVPVANAGPDLRLAGVDNDALSGYVLPGRRRFAGCYGYLDP